MLAIVHAYILDLSPHSTVRASRFYAATCRSLGLGLLARCRPPPTRRLRFMDTAYMGASQNQGTSYDSDGGQVMYASLSELSGPLILRRREQGSRFIAVSKK